MLWAKVALALEGLTQAECMFNNTNPLLSGGDIPCIEEFPIFVNGSPSTVSRLPHLLEQILSIY